MKHLASTLGLVAAVMVPWISGCAGNNSGVTAPASRFAGSYGSSLTLDGGKRGTLALTVASDSTVTGTMTVAAAAPLIQRAAVPFSFTIGTIQVSGTVDANGALNLTGTDGASGAFTIGGTLSTTGQGTVTVGAGGQTFSGGITHGGSGGGGGGGGTGDLTIANSGATINFTSFPSKGYYFVSNVGTSYSVVAIPALTDSSRTIGLTLADVSKVGQTLTVTNANNFDVASFYKEKDGPQYNAESGGIKIISFASAASFELEFINVKYTSKDAPGSFTLNGRMKR